MIARPMPKWEDYEEGSYVTVGELRLFATDQAWTVHDAADQLLVEGRADFLAAAKAKAIRAAAQLVDQMRSDLTTLAIELRLKEQK